MNRQSPEDRAVALLRAMDAEPASRAGGGRYVRGRDRQPGVRLWAATQQRYRQDLVGIQFYGRNRIEGEVLTSVLERKGFLRRTPQAGQLTFAKPVDYADDGRIDTAAVAAVRREIDLLLDGAPSAPEAPRSFREFMLASPLAEVDLPVAERPSAWRESQV